MTPTRPIQAITFDLPNGSLQADDTATIQVYKYTADSMTPVYLYYEGVERNGNIIYDYSKWTENILSVQPWIDQQAINKKALIVKFASPVTVLVTSPTGKRAGFDPIVQDYVFDFQIAISDTGDEPYEIIIPDPEQGQYTFQVTGTGSGSYTMTVQGLDAAGNETPATNILGITSLGKSDSYIISVYDEQPTQVERQVQIKVTPHEIYPKVGIFAASILGETNFNANDIDIQSIRVGKGNAQPIQNKGFIVDINKDKTKDLLTFYLTKRANISPNDTQICLTGKTKTGPTFKGCDSIKVVSKPPTLLQLFKLIMVNDAEILIQIKQFVSKIDE